VNWPPQKGWRQALREGRDPNVVHHPMRSPEAKRPALVPDASDTELLKALVLAVADEGRGDLFARVPGLVERFGGRVPEPGEPVPAHRGGRESSDPPLREDNARRLVRQHGRRGTHVRDGKLVASTVERL
jgi:hypothetical protein